MLHFFIARISSAGAALYAALCRILNGISCDRYKIEISMKLYAAFRLCNPNDQFSRSRVFGRPVLTSLEQLDIYSRPEIDSFPDRDLPTNLSCLSTRGCKKLMNPPMDLPTCWIGKILSRWNGWQVRWGLSQVWEASDSPSTGVKLATSLQRCI